MLKHGTGALSWRWMVSKHATLCCICNLVCVGDRGRCSTCSLCTFSDALTSPVTIVATRIFVVWNCYGGCQASPHHACIIMHALHIGLCLCGKVRHRGAAGLSIPCAQGGVAVAQPPAAAGLVVYILVPAQVTRCQTFIKYGNQVLFF